MSRISRFINEDTYEGDTKNPLSLNLYTYVYNNPTRYHDPSGNVPVLVALIGKQVLNYGLDVMIGVGTDYLDHLNTKSGTFNVKASIKKNAKESIVPGLGFLKKVKKAYKLADRIKDAQKKAKKAKAKGDVSHKGAQREAKRDAGISRAQKPEAVNRVDMRSAQHEVGHVIKDLKGKVISTREYYYTIKNGKKIVIQDHSAGHQKGGQGPHFNVRPTENTRNGKVLGTKEHYPFKK